MTPTREVHCQDALAFLDRPQPFDRCAFVTSLPDVSELPHLRLEGWRSWFVGAARRVMERCPEDSVAIFFQTDVRKERLWVDKGYLCQRAAEEAGARQLWHRIVCRLPPGTATHGRPAYSHLLAFSRGHLPDLSRAYPDVLPDGGHRSWTRGMGAKACALAVRYVKENTRADTVVDPFCGRGMVLAVANALGMNAVGVEVSPKRAQLARNVVVDLGALR